MNANNGSFTLMNNKSNGKFAQMKTIEAFKHKASRKI
jgi:hypothetical protein